MAVSFATRTGALKVSVREMACPVTKFSGSTRTLREGSISSPALDCLSGQEANCCASHRSPTRPSMLICSLTIGKPALMEAAGACGALRACDWNDLPTAHGKLSLYPRV